MGEPVVVFSQTGTWEATKACERFLETRGFSIGASQRGEPRGVLHGSYDIQKWRNLRPSDRAALHAVVTGDGREGPIHLRILAACPDAARDLLTAKPLALDFAASPSKASPHV